MPRPYDNSVANFVSAHSPCQEAQDHWAATGGRATMSAMWSQSTNGVWLEWILGKFDEELPADFEETKREHYAAIKEAKLAYQIGLRDGAPNINALRQAIGTAKQQWAAAIRARVGNPFV